MQITVTGLWVSVNSAMIDVFFQRKNALPVLTTMLAASYLGYVSIPLFPAPGVNEAQTGAQNSAKQFASPPQKSEQQQPDYARIENWHLFGHAADNLSTSAGKPTETQLQLKLQGILIIPGRHRQDHAIIATPDQRQKTYRIDDELPGGAKLKAVERDKIILAGNNGLEFLVLQKLASE